MKKMKYIDAAMEIVRFDFEDVLDASTQDNIGIGDDTIVGGNNDDTPGTGDPWTSQ